MTRELLPSLTPQAACSPAASLSTSWKATLLGRESLPLPRNRAAVPACLSPLSGGGRGKHMARTKGLRPLARSFGGPRSRVSQRPATAQGEGRAPTCPESLYLGASPSPGPASRCPGKGSRRGQADEQRRSRGPSAPTGTPRSARPVHRATLDPALPQPGRGYSAWAACSTGAPSRHGRSAQAGSSCCSGVLRG